jgi:8-oxo-dGTP pyrophosphatase MutT (NUDIX family)
VITNGGMILETFPNWLYGILTRKQLRQAIAEKVLFPTADEQLIFTTKRARLRQMRKPNGILVRLATHSALAHGTHFNHQQDDYLADRVSLEDICCSKLPGRYKGLRRVEGAGGIVLQTKPKPTKNKDLAILLLLKNEGDQFEWVLPKGRRERGETSRETALREVQEETGLKRLKVKKFLGYEGYFVIDADRTIYKRVRYYLMQVVNPRSKVQVQTKEGFVDGCWTNISEAFSLTNPTRAHITLTRTVSELQGKRKSKPKKNKPTK